MRIISLTPTIIADAADIPFIVGPTTEPAFAIDDALSLRDTAGAPIGFRPPMLFAPDARGGVGDMSKAPPPSAAGGGDGIGDGYENMIARARGITARTIDETAAVNPRFAVSLATPQALDKHAEGPSMRDHLLAALTMVVAIRERALTHEGLVESLGLQDISAEMPEIFQTILGHGPLLIAFVLAHDIAKPDTLAFAPSKAKDVDAAKLAALPKIFKPYKKPGNYKKLPDDERTRIDAEERTHVAGQRAGYQRLLDEFGAAHPELKGRSLQQAFFMEYPITTTYYGHSDRALEGENLDAVLAIAAMQDLPESDIGLLKALIALHMAPLTDMDGTKPEVYERFILEMRRMGVDEQIGMRLLKAAVFLDGVAGSRSFDFASGSERLDASPVKNLFQSERAYPAYAKSKANAAERERRKAILKKVLADGAIGLDSQGLMTGFGVPRGVGLGEMNAAIERAVMDGEEFSVPASMEAQFATGTRETIIQRIEFARKLLANREVETLRAQAVASIPRLRELGSWPEWTGDETITRRVPEFGKTGAPGFDAGIASALGLIPEGKQRLAAILHAAYTPQAIEQIRREMRDLDPDSETCWWLAACSICTEGSVDQRIFLQQIQKFRELAADPKKRLAAARAEFEKMTRSFTFIPELGDDVPYGTEDGSTQGAYLAGHRFGVTYVESYGVFFIGTYEPTLGLEDFPWSDEKDEQDRPKSGPVHESRQFVKAANMEELKRAIAIIRAHFVGP